jgi:hypothetical protein
VRSKEALSDGVWKDLVTLKAFSIAINPYTKCIERGEVDEDDEDHEKAYAQR